MVGWPTDSRSCGPGETFLAAATARVNTGYCHRTGTRTHKERKGAVGLDRFG